MEHVSGFLIAFIIGFPVGIALGAFVTYAVIKKRIVKNIEEKMLKATNLLNSNIAAATENLIRTGAANISQKSMFSKNNTQNVTIDTNQP